MPMQPESARIHAIASMPACRFLFLQDSKRANLERAASDQVPPAQPNRIISANTTWASFPIGS